MNGLAGLIESMATKGVLALSKRRRAAPESVLSAEGFLVGHKLEDDPDGFPQPLLLSEQDRRKHLYVLGATGCGKTNLLLRLVEDEASEGRTCVVMDLRGDLIDRLLLRLAARKEAGATSVRLIDLREDGYVMPFNPLAGSGDLYTRALHLLEVIRTNSESWGIQLEETLRNCLIALAEANRSLTDIEALLCDARFRAGVIARCSDPQVCGFFSRYDGLSAERQQAWSLPVLNKVTPLLSIPQLRRMLSSPQGFQWQKWLDRPGTLVLIALAAHRFHSASHLLGGLLISSLQASVMARASVPEKDRQPVTLFVDEFEAMATPSFGSIIAEGRRFGLSLVLTHQNLAQLDGVLRQAIRNNVYVQILFQTGSHDASDLASDVSVDGESRESVKKTLISQRVGEAFVLRRGEPSVQVTTLHSPDPVVDTSLVAEFKQSVLERWCTKAATGPEASSPSNPSHPVPEVRHVRRPRVKRSR